MEEFPDIGVDGSVGELIEFFVTAKNECLAYCVNKV